MVVTKNNLLTVLPYIGREFKISFDFLISNYGAGWKSIIHFTTDGNWEKYGDRAPGIWIGPDKDLYICSAINGNTNVCHHVKTTQQWMSVEISQTLINNKAGGQVERQEVFSVFL